jgi:hypothetical protein
MLRGGIQGQEGQGTNRCRPSGYPAGFIGYDGVVARARHAYCRVREQGARMNRQSFSKCELRHTYVEENVRAADIVLTAEDRAEIDRIVPPGTASGTRYPIGQMHRLNV